METLQDCYYEELIEMSKLQLSHLWQGEKGVYKMEQKHSVQYCQDFLEKS